MRSILILTFTAALEAQTGQSLFITHCSPCHGAGGFDGFAANLAVPRLPRAPDDRALATLVRGGLPGTDMTPAYGVTDTEVAKIVTYVRSLGRAAPQKVPGNPKRGEQIYTGKGNCASCHMLKGSGGRQGPELTEIGARRSALYLKESLTDPEKALPFEFLLVRVATANGRNLTGIRLNEDTFSIQLRDLDGAIHSFDKTELSDIRKDFGKSTMPSYKTTLSSAELDDLVAYLTTLRGDL